MMLPHNGDMISSEEVEQAIKESATVDALEVVHGRWLYDSEPFCSECNETAVFTSGHYYHCGEYCPHCGAKMDGERINEKIILCWLLLDYRKDCKKYGKENLAVPLQDRLKSYFFCIVLPVVLGLLK